ncbi:MAG: hypothetical protein ACNA8H_03960 [Anaerolineales bacterium]
MLSEVETEINIDHDVLVKVVIFGKIDLLGQGIVPLVYMVNYSK